MEEPFLLTVSYKGHDQDYEAQLQLRGYSYQIRVSVNDVDIFYERDDEGAFRAIVSAEAVEKNVKLPEAGLLEAIAQKLEELLA